MRSWIVVAIALSTVAQALAQPSPGGPRGELGDLSRPILVGDGPTGSGPIVLSGGAASPAEIRRFADAWMSDRSRAEARASACGMLYNRFDAGVWGTYEYMDAMARMYALTRDPMYVYQMDQIAACAVLYRDDNHPGPNAGESLANARYLRPRPLDQIRRRQALPAWGGRSINSANLHRVQEVVSSLYAYSIAMTARIVLEDPTLHARYGDNAVNYVNAALQTVRLLLEQFDLRDDGRYHQGFIVNHPNLRNAWNRADCDRAYADTIAAYSPPAEQDSIDWHKKQLNNCKRALELGIAGKPMSHNENNAFAMAMIEITRALNSPAYQASPNASSAADFWRGSLPVFTSRIQRYFRGSLKRDGSPPDQRYIWRHSELTDRWEDASHGGLSMQYYIVLARDRDALDRIAAPVEPIVFEPGDLNRFANTFVRMNVHPDMAVNVKDSTPTSKDNNGLCHSWIDLSIVDRRAYDRCKDRVLRIVGGKQPYLSIGNHAALLTNGR